MTLPSILLAPPDEAPAFHVDGHSIEEDSVFAQVPMTTGHSRARRVWTVPERVVTVEWLLEADAMAAVDEWFEDTLLAGTLTFPARVRNQGTGELLLWWTARWITYQTEMMNLGRGRVFGTLLLTGDGSEVGPATDPDPDPDPEPTASLTLGWELPIGTIDDQRIYYDTVYRQGTDQPYANSVLVGDGVSTSFEVTGLLPATTYYFAVAAIVGGIESNPSNETTGTTAP